MVHKIQKLLITIICTTILLSNASSCSGMDFFDSLSDDNTYTTVAPVDTSVTTVYTEANSTVPETSITTTELTSSTTSKTTTTTVAVTTTPIISTTETTTPVDTSVTTVYTEANTKVPETSITTTELTSTTTSKAITTTAATTVTTYTAKTTTEPIEVVTYAPKVESTGITLIYFDSNLVRNQDATITVKGKPNTQYTIEVYYSSGPSKAKGLENKYSDADGVVSWTWHVGGKTKLGNNKQLVILGGGEKYTTTFAVID